MADWASLFGWTDWYDEMIMGDVRSISWNWRLRTFLFIEGHGHFEAHTHRAASDALRVRFGEDCWFTILKTEPDADIDVILAHLRAHFPRSEEIME